MVKVEVYSISKEDYMKVYGEEYLEGNMWDYPKEEMDVLMEKSKEEDKVVCVALIEDRLYEIDSVDDIKEYI